jgi:hypothetical protein
MSGPAQLRILLGIPVVADLDLLRRAVDSVESLWPHTVVVDNTDSGLDHKAWPVELVRPCVPLTFSQSMNLLQSLARERSCEALLFLHSDAAVPPGTAEAMLDVLRRAVLEQRRWGIAFTYYDAFAAFSVAMADDIGRWDTTLPHYFADEDYYRRVRLAGWEVIETGLPVIHDPSSTIRSDEGRWRHNQVTYPLYERYYVAKWGGLPGHEAFARPFDGTLS